MRISDWSSDCALPISPTLSDRAFAGRDLDDRIDLYRGAQRQHRHAYRAASVAPGVAEQFGHQFRGAVGDLGLVGAIGGRIDEYAELDDPFDAVEPAERRLHLRDQPQRAALPCATALLEIALGAAPTGPQRPPAATKTVGEGKR